MNEIENKEENILKEEASLKEASIVASSKEAKDSSLELASPKEADLYNFDHPLSKYSLEDKVKLIIEYILTGNLHQACEITQIPYQVAYHWRTKSVWWSEIVDKYRKQKQDELDGQLTHLINRSAEEIRDRINNGDEVIDSFGNKRRKKLTARDLSLCFAILFDKRDKIRNTDYSKGGNLPKEELLKEIGTKMEQFAKKIRDEKIVNAISQDFEKLTSGSNS